MRKRLLIVAVFALTLNLLLRAQAPSKIGLLWTSWSVDHFKDYNAYIDQMQTWGIDYTSINPTYFINTYAEGVVDTWNGKVVTPSEDLQKSVIKELIKRKFYINYRPHVDPIKFAMPTGAERDGWSTDPGGLDWRGLFKKFNPTDPTIGYKEKVVLPGLKMLAEAIREQGAPVSPIRFDLGAELMDAMLFYPQQWIDLRDAVRELLNTEYSDVKQHIVLGHNFCHHFEYLLRLPNHVDYLKRVVPNAVVDDSLLYVDRPNVTDAQRKRIGRYIAGLDQISISQYMPLDIFNTNGATTADDVCKALLLHEKNFVEEVLVKELGIQPNELPVLHIGEYGMGWRGLTAPNVWDVAAWTKAGYSNLILSEEQQKKDAMIAIAGIIKYVQPNSGTNFRSFLLWFGGAPYDLLNINAYSNWYNADAASLLKGYWDTHAGVPDLSKPIVNLNLVANAGADVEVLDVDLNGKESVALDGSASTSTNSTIVDYSWYENSVLVATEAKPSVSLMVGNHTIQLVVKDANGTTATDDVTIIVSTNGNKIPTAVAGVDKTLNDSDGDGLASVVLDGSSSSDKDGVISSYKWSFNGSVISNVAALTVELPLGSNLLTLEVTDNEGAVSTDQVVISVTPFVLSQRVIDDFESYSDNSALSSSWMRNSGGQNITPTLNSSFATQGSKAMQLGYDFTSYAGVQKLNVSFNWSSMEGIALDLKADGSGRELIVQFKESNGEYWEAKVILSTSATEHLFIPFASFNKPSWQSDGNSVVDLNSITEVALYFGGISGSGTIYIDNMVATSIKVNSNLFAEAGANQLITLKSGSQVALVSLDGTQSRDSDGAIVAYKWKTIDGVELATGSTATVSLPAGSYVIYLTVTDNLGATFTDYLTVKIEPAVATSLSEMSSLDALVYPNPVKDRLWIRLNTPLDEGAVLRILDLSGVVLYESSSIELSTDRATEIDVNSLNIPNGVYICSINSTKTQFKRLIVVRR